MLKNERIASRCICCDNDKLVSTPSILMPFVADRAFGWKPTKIDETWGLNTIKSGNAYSICNTLFCKNCDLIFLDIRFTDEELQKIYHNYREDEYTTLREHYEPGYKLRNEILVLGLQYLDKIELFLNPFLKLPVSILDWGGDTGNNTPYKNNNKGFDIYDISNKKVINGARVVDKATTQDNLYDLIVCSHVLEHAPFPKDILIDIKKSMTDNTLLYIEIPIEKIMQEGAAFAFSQKKHWHEHINFFSEKSLKNLIKSINLNVVAINNLNVIAENKSTRIIQIACKIN